MELIPDNGSGNKGDDFRVGIHPISAMWFAALFFAALALWYLGIESLLIKNWLFTLMVAATLWVSLLWIIPRWAPTFNVYLWTELRPGVSVGRSVAVAGFAYLLGFLFVLALIGVGQFRHSDMTAHWTALWAIVLAAAVPPAIVGVVVCLDVVGATQRFRWLDVTRLLTVRSGTHRPDFRDCGRIVITIIGAASILMIQGGIVLTGGLSTSFFTVLLVSTGSVAAIASERPAYVLFTAVLSLCAAGFTELIGSYEPPSRAYYPTAHFVMITLVLTVSVLVDFGRRVRRKGQVSAIAEHT